MCALVCSVPDGREGAVKGEWVTILVVWWWRVVLSPCSWVGVRDDDENGDGRGVVKALGGELYDGSGRGWSAERRASPRGQRDQVTSPAPPPSPPLRLTRADSEIR